MILLTIFWAITAYSFGQKSETFDILSFKTPSGWQKEVKENAVQIGAEDSKGGVCLITIFKSVAGGSDSKVNFETAWEAIVKGLVTVKSAPQMGAAGKENGWILENGLAQYESDGNKGAVLLITATGNGKMVNFLVLTNTDAFQEEIDSFMGSVRLPKVETVTGDNSITESSNSRTNSTIRAVNDGFTYSTANFEDGWFSTVQNDWVLVTKGQMQVYLLYALPFDGSQFTGTGVRERDYYWDNYVSKYFNIQTKQYRDEGENTGGLQPDYVEGWATDKQTGERRFIAMTLNKSPYTAILTIASAPNEATLRQQFPKANGRYSSDLANMWYYNRFPIATNDVIGNWADGNTGAASWYYVTPSGYESYAGTTIASRSATFNFAPGGTYTSEHKGTTGSIGSLNSFKQNYRGTYKVSSWEISATNRWEGKTENFNAWFEIVRGGRILVLQNGGMKYNLLKVK